ncbi:MAG: TetR family transcriptional regulator C-terminal domain-containing protein [Bacteroidota bacterium]
MDRIHNVDQLLQTGIDMMVASGYHNTSINAVIKKAGLPKGSFYYLYKDKKAFALAALQRYTDDTVESMARTFADPALGPVAGIRQYFANSIKKFQQSNYCNGCFLGNMSLELSDVDEDFRAVIEQSLSRMADAIRKPLDLAVAEGSLQNSANTTVLADLIINTWHGTLLRMKATRSRQPLEIFINDFFNQITCNI